MGMDLASAMARELTTDDRDKTVVTAEGRRVGTVSDVDGGRARVTTDDDSEGLTDKLKSVLGWDDSEDTHDLRNDDVDSVTDDEIRLRSQ